MADLGKIRDEIDLLDKDLVKLLYDRLELAKEVANSKIISKTAVLNAEREQEVIHKVNQIAGVHSKEISTIMRAIMRISREKQYQIVCDGDNEWQIKKLILDSVDRKINIKKVAFCGTSGSYSKLAASLMYPNAEYIGVKTFEEACILAANNEVDIAVLPLENTTAGTVNEVYDHLPKYGLYIIKSFSNEIEHNLLAVEGTAIKNIKKVISHPQALAQCDKLIKKMGWEIESCDNTAFAAEFVANKKDKSIAAIASRETADAFQLKILQKSINDQKCNQTRFVALSKKLSVSNKADRISIAFTLAHKSGALADVLSIFADLELNLVKIQSRPIPEKPWEYMFYLDFFSELSNKDALRALYHLEKELPFLSFLGWYKEER